MNENYKPDLPNLDKSFIINCCISLSLVGFIQAYMGAAMPFVRDELALSPPLVAWHFSLYALGRLSSGYIVTGILQRIAGARTILIFSFSLIGFAACLSLSSSMLFTLPISYCIGLSMGTTQVATQTQIGNLHGKTREVALAQALVWAGIGSAIAPLLIGWLSNHGHPWGLVLLVPFAFALFMAATSSSLKSKDRATRKSSEKTPVSATVIVFWLLVIGGNALEWTIGLWGAQYIEIKHQLSSSNAVSLMTLFFAGTIAGRIGNVYFLRIYDCDVLYVVYVIATGLTLSIMFLSNNIYVVSMAIAATGAASGCLYPNNMSTAMKYAPNEILRITTGAAKCSGLSLLTVPLIMGYLGSAIGLENAIQLILTLPVIMLILVAFIRKSRKPIAL